MSSSTVAAQADEWSDLAVGTLLDCYNDKYIELNGGTIGTKGWQEVIAKLNSVCAEGKPVYSYRRCKNKLDVMKRRFKIERDRKANNGGVSDWPWFSKMEEIVGRNPRLGGAAAAAGGSAAAATAAAAKEAAHQQQRQEQQQQQQAQQQQQQQQQQQLQAAPLNNHRHFDDLSEGRRAAAAQHSTEEVSAGQLLSDQQEDAQTDSQQAARTSSPVSNKAGKRRRKSGCIHNPVRHAREVARIVTDALERMETRRLEVMRELELKRNETQLQIARMLIEHNNAISAAYLRHLRPELVTATVATVPPPPAPQAASHHPHSYMEQQQQQQQQQQHHHRHDQRL